MLLAEQFPTVGVEVVVASLNEVSLTDLMTTLRTILTPL